APRLGDGQAVDAQLLHLLDELVRVGVGVLEVAHHGPDLAVDEVPDELDHGLLVLVELIDHGRYLRRTSAALSQVHEPGSPSEVGRSRPATQSASLAASWSGVGGRAGEPGGYFWRARSTAPSAVCTSASSSPSSSQLPPGSSLVST